MSDLRLGQKLINYLRFHKKVKREDMQRVIFYLEDDEFQKILDVIILATPSSDLRIANYQKLLNVREYDILKKTQQKNEKRAAPRGAARPAFFGSDH